MNACEWDGRRRRRSCGAPGDQPIAEQRLAFGDRVIREDSVSHSRELRSRLAAPALLNRTTVRQERDHRQSPEWKRHATRSVDRPVTGGHAAPEHAQKVALAGTSLSRAGCWLGSRIACGCADRREPQGRGANPCGNLTRCVSPSSPTSTLRKPRWYGGIGTYTWHHARDMVQLGHEVPLCWRAPPHQGGAPTTTTGCGSGGGAARCPARCTTPGSAALVVDARAGAKRDRHAGCTARPGAHGVASTWWSRPNVTAGSLVNLVTRTPTVCRFHSPARLIMSYYDVSRGDVRASSVVEGLGVLRGGSAHVHVRLPFSYGPRADACAARCSGGA